MKLNENIDSEHERWLLAALSVSIRYVPPGLGSILDTVSKDTEDTASLVSVSVS